MKIGDIDVAVIRRGASPRLLIHTRLQNYETVPVTADQVRDLARYLESEAAKFANRKEMP